MKIAVLVKQTPDTETKAKVSAAGLDLTGVKFILNPYDEFAVEEAIKTRDATKGTATVISVGPDRVIDAERTALAMGCDDGIHIKVSEEEYKNCDSFVVSKALSEVIKQKGFQLVLCGKQAIDDDALAVPQMVAELLGWARATVVTKIEDISGAKVKVRRAADGGAEEVMELTAPVLIAANKGLNTPRYASLPGIMKAKQKKVEVVPLESLGLGAKDSKIEATHFELPPEKAAGKIFNGTPEELAKQIVDALRNEAKVI
ncbi:MAG: electron transfer flavoprotein subunit beta/FixA family protein [Bdellovibrionota bacterium]